MFCFRFGENNSVSTFFNSFNTSNNIFNTSNNSHNNNNSNIEKQLHTNAKHVPFTVTQSIIADENRKLHYELTKTTTELKLVTQQLLEAEETIKKLGSDVAKPPMVSTRLVSFLLRFLFLRKVCLVLFLLQYFKQSSWSLN